MRKSTKFLSAIAVAGMIAASGSAFTNSNTQQATSVAGYGSTSASGVTVDNIAYNVSTTDASKLASIDFTVDEDVSGAGYEAILTINGPTNTQIECTRGFVPGTPGVGTISCPTTANVADVTSIALTVAEV